MTSPNPEGGKEMKDTRLRLRFVSRDKYSRPTEIKEQQIPANAHNIHLALRRSYFSEQISSALLSGGSVTVETVSVSRDRQKEERK